RMRLQLSSELPSSMNSTRTSQSARANSVARTASSYAARPVLSLYTGVRISTFGLPLIVDPVLEFGSGHCDQLAVGRHVTLPQAVAHRVRHRIARLGRVDHVEAERVVGPLRDAEERVQPRCELAGAKHDVVEL